MQPVRINFQPGLDIWDEDEPDQKGYRSHEGGAGRWMRPDLPPGTAQWNPAYHGGAEGTGPIAALTFICPCGCGSMGALTVRRPGTADRPSWAWNGDEVNPTLAPSIQKTSPCRWHGFLERGWFVLQRDQAPK